MMKKPLIILVFTFIPLLSFCQNYVINVKGDTLKGEIKILTMEPVDQVRIVINKKKTFLTALTAKTVFYNNEQYNSVRYNNTQKFMKVIKYGYLSLYAFKLPSRGTYDQFLLVKISGQSSEVPNLGFKKIMMGFLSECPAVADAIEGETLKSKDLHKIIDQFNACVYPPKKNNSEIHTLASANTSENLNAVDEFKKKIEALDTFSAKKDVLDILGDIKAKLEKQELVPSYLYSTLKTHLANQPTVSEDLEKLIALLTK